MSFMWPDDPPPKRAVPGPNQIVVREHCIHATEPMKLRLPEGTEVLLRQDPIDRIDGARLVTIETDSAFLVERTFIYVPRNTPVDLNKAVGDAIRKWRFKPVGAVRHCLSSGVLFEAVLP